MKDAEIKQIRDEIASALIGRQLDRIFPLSKHSFAIDFHPHAAAYLFINIAPRSGRIYLIRRRLKELERSSTNPDPFILKLKSLLTNAKLTAVEKQRSGPDLNFVFQSETDSSVYSFVVSLGGSRPNLFLLDEVGVIIAAFNQWEESGQKIGERYETVEAPATRNENPTVKVNKGGTLSETLDEFYREQESETIFQTLASQIRKKINAEIAKQQKLIKNLHGDLEKHGDAEKWKRYGDLILANVSNAKRDGDTIFVIDYFDENIPTIEIIGDEHRSLNEIAESYFRRYTKARNGAAAIAERIEKVNSDIAVLNSKKEKIEAAIEARDEEYLSSLTVVKAAITPIGSRKKHETEFKGARRFFSSDGFEILVGKKAKDNDYLSFRVAKSLDLWLHAADYPGSHVIVRNPNRKEIPNKTLLEAAQLAAFYSSGREQVKAAVNYTPKKFVNKPKRSAPGLVSLASFKTILVEPQVAIKSES